MKNHGGKRQGAGRKSLSKEQKAFENIYKFLPQAVGFLKEAFGGVDKDLKKWATEMVLKRIVAEKKQTELVGEDHGPLLIKIISEK